MQRYRQVPQLSLGLLLALGGCSAPTQRENLDAATRLVTGQLGVPLEWRLNSSADAEARLRAEALLVDGLTPQEAVTVSFLASPELQLALEELEIKRSDFVAAATASNPVAIAGSRAPGGDLSSFYPDRNYSFGILQSVFDLLQIPGRRSVAKLDLERARYLAAQTAVRLAAEVSHAWVDYAAALQVQELREQVVGIYQEAYDELQADQASNPDITAQVLEDRRRELLNRRSDAVQARLEAVRTRELLGEQLGLSGWRDDWSLQSLLPELPASDPDPGAGEQAAMDRRLDIQAANQSVEARLKMLAHQRRFRWLGQVDIGLFRDEASGGTSFTGPTAIIEVPVFDQRKAALLNADSTLRTELRSLEATRLAARREIRTRSAEIAAGRLLVRQIEQEIRPGQLQALSEGGGAGGRVDPELRLDMVSTEEGRILLLRDYWRARIAFALAVGDWGALGGLQ
jgi:outer membrane protein TolC